MIYQTDDQNFPPVLRKKKRNNSENSGNYMFVIARTAFMHMHFVGPIEEFETILVEP